MLESVQQQHFAMMRSDKQWTAFLTWHPNSKYTKLPADNIVSFCDRPN